MDIKRFHTKNGGKYIKIFQLVDISKFLIIVHCEKMNPFFKKISNGHSVYNVYSAHTCRPTVPPKARTLKIFCVLFLQESEHSIFDTHFKKKYFKIGFSPNETYSFELFHNSGYWLSKFTNRSLIFSRHVNHVAFNESR